MLWSGEQCITESPTEVLSGVASRHTCWGPVSSVLHRVGSFINNLARSFISNLPRILLTIWVLRACTMSTNFVAWEVESSAHLHWHTSHTVGCNVISRAYLSSCTIIYTISVLCSMVYEVSTSEAPVMNDFWWLWWPMITGDGWGLSFLGICLTVEENPRKNLNQQNWPNR